MGLNEEKAFMSMFLVLVVTCKEVIGSPTFWENLGYLNPYNKKLRAKKFLKIFLIRYDAG